jgi:hypothetical protein
MALKNTSMENPQRIITSNKRSIQCRQRNEGQEQQQGQQLVRQRRLSHHYYNITTTTVTALAITATLLNLVSYVTAFTTTTSYHRQQQQHHHDQIHVYYRPSSITFSSLHSSTTIFGRSTTTATTATKSYGLLPTFATPSKSKTGLFLAPRPAGSGGKSDQAEWKALLMALQLYKAAYGDLKVPVRFVVPSMAPWPGMYTHIKTKVSISVDV